MDGEREKSKERILSFTLSADRNRTHTCFSQDMSAVGRIPMPGTAMVGDFDWLDGRDGWRRRVMTLHLNTKASTLTIFIFIFVVSFWFLVTSQTVRHDGTMRRQDDGATCLRTS